MIRTRYGVRKILNAEDDQYTTELVVLTVRELLYARGAHEVVDWTSLRVDVEVHEHVVLYARIDVETVD